MSDAGFFFHEKAKHCRRMAKIAVSADGEERLLTLARRFDEQAAEIDNAMSGNKPVAQSR
jgi:hypothetical protein